MTRLINAWYQGAWWCYLLWPFSLIFRALIVLRRMYWWIRANPLPVKVIVVGNITVGGSGKTPWVMWLAEHLKKQGWRPGIVMRGYRARCEAFPFQVQARDAARRVGDEACLLRQTGVPVVLDPCRPRGVRYLAKRAKCNVVISDDGLQHYAMRRDLELIILDQRRGLGRGFCLPAGPLREPVSRLESADFILTNQVSAQLPAYHFELKPGRLTQLAEPGKTQPLSVLKNKTVHAVAGIGHPERFFDMLKSLGAQVIPHAFPDHHEFSRQDLEFGDEHSVVMTEKDAVKLNNLPGERYWFIPVTVVPDPDWITQFDAAISTWTR